MYLVDIVTCLHYLQLIVALCTSTTEYSIEYISSFQFSSVAQSCPTVCDPMNHRMPGLRVHHQLPEFTQTHVH